MQNRPFWDRSVEHAKLSKLKSYPAGPLGVFWGTGKHYGQPLSDLGLLLTYAQQANSSSVLSPCLLPYNQIKYKIFQYFHVFHGAWTITK